jgi:acyl CoA:acetate/3-ketoacid CoA transferase beta subunit
MKPKPDPDLAAWCEALASPIVPDEVPPGWLTARELATKLKKGNSTMNHLLATAVAEGRAERQLFRIASGQVTRPVPHYRLR